MHQALRYLFMFGIWQGEFLEDLLCCLTLPSSTSGAHIFEQLNAFITKSGLDWANCKGITSDGAANLTGKNSGVVRRIKDAAGQNIVWYHCFIHREALASKGIPPELEIVMRDTVKVVNYIKGSALNSRLFEALCVEMGAEHKHLLFHTDVRWLSKGRVLSRVYELRDEIRAFLTDKLSPLASQFSDEKWLLTLSYLADIFSVLNELNLKLQGREDNIFRHCEQIQAFQKSLELWQLRLKTASYYMFPTMMKRIEENDVPNESVAGLTRLIQSHLDALMGKFSCYIPQAKFDELKDKRWVKNPFDFETPDSIAELNLTPEEESEMIQLTSDNTLKTRHKTEKLSSFWIGLFTEYPMLSKASISLLLPFTTTYMCETGFSVLTKMKTKQRNKLNASPDMRVALSSCEPAWDQIMQNKQAHPSH